MPVRLVVSLVLSGVAHAGALLAVAGLDEQLDGGPKAGEGPYTLRVSINIEADAGSAPASPASEPEDGSGEAPGRKRTVPHRDRAPRREPSLRPDVMQQAARLRDDRSALNNLPKADAQQDQDSRPRASREQEAVSASDPTAGPRSASPWEPPAGGEPGTEPTGTRSAATSREPVTGAASRREHQTQAEQTYLADLLAALSRHKRYPRSARLRRQQGRVVVGLVLQNDGTITQVKIARPSGHSVLNRAALRSVHSLARFKPFPPDVNRQVWRLSIPFQYSIDGS